jgi:hypothetical protein
MLGQDIGVRQARWRQAVERDEVEPRYLPHSGLALGDA